MGNCLLAVVLVLALQLAAGADALHFAASSGNIEGLRQLIVMEHRSVDSVDKNGSTPLMSAAGSGQVEAVEYLLSAGARLDLFDRYGDTALHRAVKGQHVQVVRLLLSAGAPADGHQENHLTPLVSTQCWPEYLPIIKLLLENNADPNFRGQYDGPSTLPGGLLARPAGDRAAAQTRCRPYSA